MNKDRAEKILSRPANADAVLISDPAAIYYLTGRWIHPGERFLGLLLSRTEEPKLFLNILFPFEETAGLKIISYSDTDDITELLAKHIKRDWVLGVDKNLTASFLLPMQKAGIARDFVNGSLAVDKTRAVKDEEEKQLMRKASAINDEAMGIFRTLVSAKKKSLSRC